MSARSMEKHGHEDTGLGRMSGNASQVHIVSLHFWNVQLDDDITAFPDISLLGFSIPGVSGASAAPGTEEGTIPHQGEQERGRKASLNYHSVIPAPKKSKDKIKES